MTRNRKILFSDFATPSSSVPTTPVMLFCLFDNSVSQSTVKKVVSTGVVQKRVRHGGCCKRGTKKGPEFDFILFCGCKQGRLRGQEGRIFLQFPQMQGTGLHYL